MYHQDKSQKTYNQIFITIVNNITYFSRSSLWSHNKTHLHQIYLYQYYELYENFELANFDDKFNSTYAMIKIIII